MWFLTVITSHVRIFVCLLLLHFIQHHVRSQLQSLPCMSNNNTNNNNNNILSYTQRPKRTVPVAFSSQYPYHIFWCVFNFHIAKTTTAPPHTDTLSYICAHIKIILSHSQWLTPTIYVFAMPCHHLNYVRSFLLCYIVQQKTSYVDTHSQISRKVKSERILKWMNGNVVSSQWKLVSAEFYLIIIVRFEKEELKLMGRRN